jgi:phenylacetate-coenzyme A ligase PaaK-like adenylate-forming protein
MSLSYHRKRFADVAAALKLSRELTQRERWPREQLDRFRQERFDALVEYATVHSPYYRERSGEPPAPIDKRRLMENFDAIVTDPRLRRDDLLSRVDSYNGDELELGRYRVMCTSGSSGRKGLYVYDRPAWAELLAGFFRYNAMAGLKPRLPRLKIAAIGGASGSHMTQRIAQTMSVGLHRVLSLHVTQPIDQLVEALNRFQPDFMNVFPSIGALLAEEQISGRLRIGPTLMSTSSELCTHAMGARMEEAFGITPFNFYATTEGLWGVECEMHEGIHLFEDLALVENVDAAGRPVVDGELGDRLLVTNLYNRTQPLIRFEVSDSVTLDSTPCSCGRTLRRMRSIEGRRDDVLDLGGVMVHPMQFASVARDPEVVEFQVVEEESRLLLRVVPRGEAPALEKRLKTTLELGLRELGVHEPAIEIERAAALPRQAGGKLQIVIARSYAPAREDRGRELQGTDASRA